MINFQSRFFKKIKGENYIMNEEKNELSVVRVTNSGAYELDSALIIMSHKKYRLLCVNEERSLFDGEYKSIARAKAAFANFCKKRVTNSIRINWSEPYQPSIDWIESKLKLCSDSMPQVSSSQPFLTMPPIRKGAEVIILSNAFYFGASNAFIICDNNYRLIALNENRVLYDEYYDTVRGAKIAFIKVFKEKAFQLGDKGAADTQWTIPYPPDVIWLQEKLKIVEKFNQNILEKKSWKGL